MLLIKLHTYRTITYVKGLKNVKLEVTPEVVEQGQEAILRCSYELEDEPLYSLKFYRGEHEFYRYSPNERPQTKIFNFTWIEVDASRSSESQVTIRKVDFILKGNFSCEVTTNPSYTTMTSTKSLTVVSVPRGKPVIASERKRYEPGETLRANCSIPLSRPAARIFFTLNDDALHAEDFCVRVIPRVIVSGVDASATADTHLSFMPARSLALNTPLCLAYKFTPLLDCVATKLAEVVNEIFVKEGEASREGDSRQSIDLSMPLKSVHYSLSGELKLRCNAKIADMYDEWSELRLGSSRQREPVPASVRSSSSSNRSLEISDLRKLWIIIMFLIHSR
uniref:Ig-like domain-containing protein n=1 Tax=Trichogramma kaykai TaxID=54128 RepID=A0ABD2W310_9HYME